MSTMGATREQIKRAAGFVFGWALLIFLSLWALGGWGH